jgi:hypothetical protein
MVLGPIRGQLLELLLVQEDPKAKSYSKQD